jgi:hypothetical protein
VPILKGGYNMAKKIFRFETKNQNTNKEEFICNDCGQITSYLYVIGEDKKKAKRNWTKTGVCAHCIIDEFIDGAYTIKDKTK